MMPLISVTGTEDTTLRPGLAPNTGDVPPMPKTDLTLTTSRRALLAGVPAALALGTAPALAAEPNASADAEIIRLAGAILAGHAESTRLSLLEDDLDFTPKGRLQRAQLRARIEPFTRDGWDMRARLAGMQASTLAGRQARPAWSASSAAARTATPAAMMMRPLRGRSQTMSWVCLQCSRRRAPRMTTKCPRPCRL